MAADIPTAEPTAARAGDTWKWTKSLADYPASTWTLKYYFKSSTSGFSVTATASGDDHSVTVAAATTAAYTAGNYRWIASAESGSEKFTVDEGTLEVQKDYRGVSASTGVDDRSHARIVLDAIKAVIEGRASKDQEEYTIAGRSLKRTPITTLLKMRQHYETEAKAEANAEAIADGTGKGGRIQFRIG